MESVPGDRHGSSRGGPRRGIAVEACEPRAALPKRVYAKQSYTTPGICSFPEGYVEPVPKFWRRLSQMARRTAKFSADIILDDPNPNMRLSMVRQVDFLNHFATHVDRLELISLRELAHQPTDAEDLRFFNTMIEYSTPGFGSGSIRQLSGWYPTLFYRTLRRAGVESL